MTIENALKWTFESLRAHLDDLDTPVVEKERHAFWVSERLLGIARAPHGGIEIFLVGPPLRPHTAVVSRHLEYNRWAGAEGSAELPANRVVLPAAPHFVSLAALIAIELIRAGLERGRSLQAVFDDVEPILELALRRGALTQESIVGLLGELLTLEQSLSAVSDRPELRHAVLDMWRGHVVGERDFIVGSVGVEVKTTRLSTSSHHINSLRQIEPSRREDGGVEDLWLLSIGVSHTQEAGFTLPQVVDRLLALLHESALPAGIHSPLQQRLLRDIAAYGAPGGFGYDHVAMASWGIYQQKLVLTFTPRLYEMADPDVRFIRRADLVGTFVSPDDIHYRVDLPDVVGPRNPVLSWQRALVKMVRRGVGLST